MKIPAADLDRFGFYNEVADECLESRQDRISYYERLRSYYLWGCSPESTPATFNKILPQIDLLVSFLFAAETAKFGIIVGESAQAERDIAKVPALTKLLNGKWADSNADMQYGQAVAWSLVYGSMFIKLIQRGRNTVPYLVQPHQFGVLREDMPFLDDQDAFCHVYTISKRSLDRLLVAHPNRARILASVSSSLRGDEGAGGGAATPNGVNRILMSNFPMTGAPNGPGVVSYPGMIDGYRARVTDERVEMRELWVWDDDKNDYRIVTQTSGGICIYDRENFYLAGEHDFIQVCPNPAPDYLFGYSEVDRLTQLQDARETRMQQVIELLNRQVKPPTSQRGMWQGIPDETQYAREVFGGGMASSDPMADFKVYAPTVPTDTFAEVREYDAMFNEMTGLSNVTQGKGESGVRSRGHAAELARLGSARIKSRAYRLEDGLDKMGTHYLRLIQQHDPTPMMADLPGGKKERFIAEQFTKDFAVKVDGHSSSPIFVEDYKEMAAGLFKAGVITGGRLIDMIDPPSKQIMQEEFKALQAARAKAAQEEKQAERQKEALKSVK